MDKERLVGRYGQLRDETMTAVEAALRIATGLDKSEFNVRCSRPKLVSLDRSGWTLPLTRFAVAADNLPANRIHGGCLMVKHSFVLAAALLLAAGAESWAGSGKTRRTASADAAGQICKVYALSDLGDDPGTCAWIARTIVDLIEPGTWKTDELSEKKGFLTVHAASRLLVVSHTPEVHGRIDALLKDMVRATKAGKGAESFAISGGAPAVMRADYVMPTIAATGSTATPAVPTTPAKAAAPHGSPKHLFHIIVEGLEVAEGSGSLKLKNFTLRYEGEGIIDSTVADVIKSLSGKDASKSSSSAEEASMDLLKLLGGLMPIPGVQSYVPDASVAVPARTYETTLPTGTGATTTSPIRLPATNAPDAATPSDPQTPRTLPGRPIPPPPPPSSPFPPR